MHDAWKDWEDLNDTPAMLSKRMSSIHNAELSPTQLKINLKQLFTKLWYKFKFYSPRLFSWKQLSKQDFVAGERLVLGMEYLIFNI